jgi:hypothetical protein
VKIIKAEYDQERNDIEKGHELETEELTEMINTIKDEENAKLQQMMSEYDSLREETKNRNVEELEGMKFILIGKIEELDKEFQVHYNQFSSETKQTAKSYETKLEQNKVLSTEITNSTRAIERHRNTKIYWQLKIEQNDREFTQRNSELNTEKMKIYNHYKKLKQNMNKQRDEKERHIGMLAMNSLKCMETLRDYQSLGEKILKTAELCRKLETEKEKVLPFY